MKPGRTRNKTAIKAIAGTISSKPII
jgi:hypothetical protein